MSQDIVDTHVWRGVAMALGRYVVDAVLLEGRSPTELARTHGKTLTVRKLYEICPVCFWEDDDQGDVDADKIRGGPNRDLSLTQARNNFKELSASSPRQRAFTRPPLPNEGA